MAVNAQLPRRMFSQEVPMKRFLALMLALLAFTASLPCAAPAETILW